MEEYNERTDGSDLFLASLYFDFSIRFRTVSFRLHSSFHWSETDTEKGRRLTFSSTVTPPLDATNIIQFSLKLNLAGRFCSGCLGSMVYYI